MLKGWEKTGQDKQDRRECQRVVRNRGESEEQQEALAAFWFFRISSYMRYHAQSPSSVSLGPRWQDQTHTWQGQWSSSSAWDASWWDQAGWSAAASWERAEAAAPVAAAASWAWATPAAAISTATSSAIPPKPPAAPPAVSVSACSAPRVPPPPPPPPRDRPRVQHESPAPPPSASRCETSPPCRIPWLPMAKHAANPVDKMTSTAASAAKPPPPQWPDGKLEMEIPPTRTTAAPAIADMSLETEIPVVAPKMPQILAKAKSGDVMVGKMTIATAQATIEVPKVVRTYAPEIPTTVSVAERVGLFEARPLHVGSRRRSQSAHNKIPCSLS
jgi:hypothetical protein